MPRGRQPSEVDVGTRVAVLSDAHGATRILESALERCREEGVDSIALLGDLFDRHEQADGCARAFEGWRVVGVYGNHEREVALAAASGRLNLRAETLRFLSALREEVVIGDALLTHDVDQWESNSHDVLARVVGRGFRDDDRQPRSAAARLTFTGHTHYRQARDERGALDIGRGRLPLDPARRYLINPGALQLGQFAIWDRSADVVSFKNVR